MTTPAIALLLGSSQPPGEILAAATAAERGGFDELWVGEDYFFSGAFSIAGSLLAATRLPVGIGIVPSVTRHPAVTAMEIATLAGMYPGRIRAGVGTGVPDWLDAMNLRPRSPLGSLRDTLRALRTLLEGGTLTGTFAGFTAEGIVLEHPPTVLPELYGGVSGPKALRMTGAEADGAILSALAGPPYVEWARRQLAEGGGDQPRRVVAYTLCAVDRDRDHARERLRELVGLYLLTGPRNPLTEVQGIADAAEELAALGLEKAIPKIPDSWIDRLTVTGTPQDCADRITALHRAGADCVALALPPDQPTDAQVERIARDVLPLLDRPARGAS
ncbi:LLM class flavin-dependent oxidoreductase [Embleya sp. AB8]|uniref:LLM class flavin-dependent oxidoreductase n=1 Tax=Embleya sp. AB8 TaxID=3156304 RepID=UPI003C778255